MSPRTTLVSAIKGIITHFAFLSKRGKADKRVLVDSSATENFMDHSMIRHLGIGTRKLSVPRRIFNVDGTENIAGQLTEFCTLRVRKGDQNHLQTFYVTSLGADQAILGYPWLRIFNPRINWEEGRILGPEIRIETCSLGKQRRAVLGRVLEAARKDLAWEKGDEVIIMAASAHTLQQWAIEANKCKQTIPTLPVHYQQHARLFSENAAQRFPLLRPEDLAVRLKPGAPDTINCKVYPLARHEIQAAAEFTSKNEELGRIRKVNSPWGLPFFFIKKKDGSLRPIQDYWTVNSWIERDVYPMPHIKQILEQLNGKVLFTTLDIRDGYNNIRI